MRKALKSGFFTLLVLFSLFVAGCEIGREPAGPTVYSAGRYSKETTASPLQVPCYWINSTKYELSVDNPTYNAMATSIFVSADNTVFTCGNYNDGIRNIACYWIGTTKHDLSGSGINSYANSILVSGGAVYIAGYFNNGPKNIPCYWRNNTIHLLLDSGGMGYADDVKPTSIYASGGSIYIGGEKYSVGGGKYLPCYWKNVGEVTETEKTLTSHGANSAGIYGLTVSGRTVYAAGYVFNTATSKHTPYCWSDNLDGDPTPVLALQDDGRDGSALAVCVSGSSVYSAGACNDGLTDRACYWTSEARTYLSAGNGSATSIFVTSGSDIYIGGQYFDGSRDVPCYWKNGTATILPGIGTNFGYIDSIFVK